MGEQPAPRIPVWGLARGSTRQQKVVRVGPNRAIRFRVVRDTIDLRSLRREKRRLVEQLAEPEPAEPELVEMARFAHPFYQKDTEGIRARIAEIDELLNV